MYTFLFDIIIDLLHTCVILSHGETEYSSYSFHIPVNILCFFCFHYFIYFIDNTSVHNQFEKNVNINFDSSNFSVLLHPERTTADDSVLEYLPQELEVFSSNHVQLLAVKSHSHTPY